MELDFEHDEAENGAPFVVDVDGFEGPLDLLLDLARRQKVDLQKISVLALAEQYLEFIEAARSLRLELAADYLVMAAWLAYLKSRLLLPQAAKDEGARRGGPRRGVAIQPAPSRRAIRAAAEALVSRSRLGRDVFPRGQPELTGPDDAPQWKASLYDLLSAYAQRRQKHALTRITLKQRFVWSLAQARTEIEKLATGRTRSIGLALEPFLAALCTTPERRRTIRASSLSASLEMAREGVIQIRQDAPFAPLWIKSQGPAANHGLRAAQ